MDNQALGVADIGQMRKQLDRVDEPLARLQSALDSKANQGPVVSLEILLRDGMTGVILKSRVPNPVNGRRLLQPFRVSLLFYRLWVWS